jgi:hypothetical protein
VNPSRAVMCTVRSRCVLWRAERTGVMRWSVMAVCAVGLKVRGVLCAVRGVQ